MRKTKYFIMIIALIFVFVMGVYLCAEYYSDKYSENLLRFHILANSNSPEDQALKIKVRDHLSKTIFSLTENSKDALETEKIIEENKEFIIEEAEKNGDVLVIRPPEKLPVGRVEHNPDKLQIAYDIGVKTALAQLEEIKSFIAK